MYNSSRVNIRKWPSRGAAGLQVRRSHMPVTAKLYVYQGCAGRPIRRVVNLNVFFFFVRMHTRIACRCESTAIQVLVHRSTYVLFLH